MPTKKKRDMSFRAMCCVCREPIGHVIPWTSVTVTGDVIRWHPGCHSALIEQEQAS